MEASTCAWLTRLARRDILRDIPWVVSVERDADRIRVGAPVERAADLNAALAGAGFFCSEIRPREQSLEEFFLDVTGAASEASDRAAAPGSEAPT